MGVKRVAASLIAHSASLLLPPRVMRNKRFFALWEKRGYHVTPSHFYEPIPDTRTLQDDLWSKPSELVGIDMNEEGQTNLLSGFISEFRAEYEGFPRKRTPIAYQYYVDNGAFESVDGEILYCMIRHFKPERMIEVGSGYSTLLSAQAVARNAEEGHPCDLMVIDPYPSDTVKAGCPGVSRLIPEQAQNIPSCGS